MKNFATFCLGFAFWVFTSSVAAQQPAWLPQAPVQKNETQVVPVDVRADEDQIALRQFGLGAEFRMNLVPEFFLNLFLRAAHEVKSPSVAGKFIYRTRNLDLILKGAYWDIQAPDGNWLGMNHDWDEMDYMEFKKFRFAWGQVSVMWNQPLITGLYFIYGGGIGVGAVLGDIYKTPAYGCTADNWREVSTTPLIGCWHSSLDPNREKEDIPRVMAALEATFGLRYDLFSNVSFKLETGLFLPGFWHVTGSVELLF